jgi:hypothetical protein
MNEKLIRPIFRFFNNKTKNAEFYKNHGSVWLIFTKEKRWVFELTKEGTLWYNYYLFNDVFKYFSLGVVENQQYITEWVENIIQNGVIKTKHQLNLSDLTVEDTIQNGVKETTPGGYFGSIEMKGKIVHQFESPKQNNEVEDTIQNGVKYTYSCPYNDPTIVEDTIQNGVKYTTVPSGTYHWRLEDTIQNGVKHTEYGDWLDGDERLDEIIQNGIKETRLEQNITEGEIDDIIQNGIKETRWRRVDNHPTFVDRIIEIINPS